MQNRIRVADSVGYEESYLGYNAVESVDSQPTFRRNKSPSSCSSEKSVDYRRTTRCYISGDTTLHKGYNIYLKGLNMGNSWNVWKI
jgi:hypothetical protein